MPILIKISWLVPFLPLAGSLIVGALLVCFSRTLNRLTKPVSFFLITCVAISTLISGILLDFSMSGNLTNFSLNIFESSLNYQIFFNKVVEEALLGVGGVILLIMIASFYKLERRTGYVRYFVFLGVSCGLTFLFVLSGNGFDQLYQALLLTLTKIGNANYLS